MKNKSLLASYVGLAILVTSFSTTANAGQDILIDQGDNYTFNGQNWEFPGGIFTTGGSNTGTIPFLLNIGAGAASYGFVYDARGQATFVSSGGAATGNFIAPLRSATAFRPDSSGSGLMVWGAGRVDPLRLLASPTPGQTYDIANALQVFRFSWVNVCPVTGACDGTDSVSSQALLINRGGGDFDLNFNYGRLQSSIPSDAFGGFTLDANLRTIAAFTSPGPDFCFRGGVVGACGTTTGTVPEPATMALLAGGLGLIGATRLRRRRQDPASTPR